MQLTMARNGNVTPSGLSNATKPTRVAYVRSHPKTRHQQKFWLFRHAKICQTSRFKSVPNNSRHHRRRYRFSPAVKFCKTASCESAINAQFLWILLTTINRPIRSRQCVKYLPAVGGLICTNKAVNHIDDPNSAIHFSYLSRSALETVLLTFFNACSKSSILVGVTSSSFGMFLISSGLSPSIRRRIDIIAASLKDKQRRHTLKTAGMKIDNYFLVGSIKYA